MGGRRRGRGLFFILASSFPAPVPPAAAGRARGQPAAPAWFPARAPGPAGLALPRWPRRLGPMHRRRPAAGPGRALAPRGGPAAQPGSSCGPRAAGPKRREARWHSVSAESARAHRASRPPTGRDAGSCGGCAGRGGGGGWKALRWRWAWPFASGGGAVALRAPSSPAARAAPFSDGSPARALGGPGRGGHAPRAEVCMWALGGVVWSFPVPPDPKE